MPTKYDAVVIGGGPAGCAAATQAAKLGLHVLLVERKEHPRTKSCCGILIKRAQSKIKDVFNAPIPVSVLTSARVSRGIAFYGEKSNEPRFMQDSLSVKRELFDAWMFDHAKHAGAETASNTRAHGVTDEGESVTVGLSNGKWQYEVTAGAVIVCGGAAPAIRYASHRNGPPTVLTVQRTYSGELYQDADLFAAYLQKEFSNFDAYVLSKEKDEVTVGTVADDFKSANRYLRQFTDYLTSEHIVRLDEPVAEERWMLPDVVKRREPYYGRGRVLYAGDAAGFLNPMGEGISCALESGAAAAQAIRRTLTENPNDRNAFSQNYREFANGTAEYMNSQWALTSRLFPEWAQRQHSIRGNHAK